MRKMILAEVQLFRQHVRVQQPQSQLGGHGGPGNNVPIPEHGGQWTHEDPRPQEAAVPNMGLEQELQRGLDARGIDGMH